MKQKHKDAKIDARLNAKKTEAERLALAKKMWKSCEKGVS